ncbi:hypothetical protein [Pseudomonas oryzihabitans]|uniref:hypothetical protein n=1 Tax=Pseudomonas oryzihabitans TaxID=47885 RepID=UPI0028A13AE4|nr:hypothetical protein [Pseudomonas oryzihabitans]
MTISYYRDEIRHESGLLLGRLNALFSCQAFLMIAYASSLSSSNGHWHQPFTIILPPFLALLGAMLAFEAQKGIAAAHETIKAWQDQLDSLLKDQSELSHPYYPPGFANVHLIRRKGELFSIRTPWIFQGSWLILTILPFCLHFAA